MKKYLILLILFIPLQVFALDFPDIISEYGTVYDLTSKEILYEKNSTTKTSVASLTKILTTITAIEEIDNLEEDITITSDLLKGIYWDASRAGLKVGDIVTYKDLLYATILPSGADAAQVLALSLEGTLDNFVFKMNSLAKKIGMNDSNFVNITGLDESGHYSTAKDISILLAYALNNPIFKEVYTTKSYTLKSGLTVNSTLKMYNDKLNIDTSRILGSKTGTTENAGLCLSTLFNFKDHEIIIITIHAPQDNNYYNLIDNLNIIDFIDNNYEINKEEEEKVEVIEEKVNYPEIVKENKIIIDKNIIFVLVIIIIVLYILRVLFRKKRR